MATNTATSFTNHTAPGSGSTAGPYSISFDYLDQSDVDVTVNGTLQALGVSYTFTSGTQITFTSGNEPANGAAIVIRRDTNISAKKVDFQDGSVLTETDLDTNTEQILFGLQEFTDKINGIEDGATGDQTPAEILAAIVQVDGAGSGLDADKLDGQEGSYYLDQANLNLGNIRIGVTDANEIDTSSGNLTIDSAGGTTTIDDHVTITGNLTVNGTSDATTFAGHSIDKFWRTDKTTILHNGSSTTFGKVNNSNVSHALSVAKDYTFEVGKYVNEGIAGGAFGNFHITPMLQMQHLIDYTRVTKVGGVYNTSNGDEFGHINLGTGTYSGISGNDSTLSNTEIKHSHLIFNARKGFPVGGGSYTSNTGPNDPNAFQPVLVLSGQKGAMFTHPDNTSHTDSTGGTTSSGLPQLARGAYTQGVQSLGDPYNWGDSGYKSATEACALLEAAIDFQIILGGARAKNKFEIGSSSVAGTLSLSGQDVTATGDELNVLDGFTGSTSELNKLNGLTASTTELNLLVNKTVVTSIAGNATDNQLPSAQAVNERIVELVTEVGGFHPIADETSFPTTNPDINDGAGTIVSIANAAGLKVADGSGSGTYAGTAGNSIGATTTAGTAVTITGIDSSLHGTTIAGKGMLVETTSTLNEYTYHRLVVDEAGVANADTLVSNFNERYYGPLSSNPATKPSGANRQDGDLYFNTSDNKMKVYNGTHASGTWDDVATPGNFFINTLSTSSGSGGGQSAFDGTATRFTLSNPPLTAQQLLVSVNGVIQKPNSGTSPSEGFAIDGADIIFAAPPALNAPFFIITIGSSVSIGTPSDGTVTTIKLDDGAVTDAKVSSSAAIARSKLANVDVVDDTSPQLGGNLDTNGNNIQVGDGGRDGNQEHIRLGNDGDLRIYHTAGGDSTIEHNSTGTDLIIKTTATGDDIILESEDEIIFRDNGGSTRLKIDSSGTTSILNSSGNTMLELQRTDANTTGAHGTINFTASDGHSVASIGTLGDGDNEGADLVFRTTSAAASSDPFNAATPVNMTLDSSGQLGIGVASPSGPLHVYKSSGTSRSYFESGDSHTFIRLLGGSASHNTGLEFFSGSSANKANITARGDTGSLQFDVGSLQPAVTMKSSGNVELVDGNLELASGHGINFHNYGSGTNIESNLLNDYETGTWLPAISQGIDDGSGGSPTYTVQNGNYVKIGSLVQVSYFIQLNTTVGTVFGTGLRLEVGGLPFTIQAIANNHNGFGSTGYHTIVNNVGDVPIMHYGTQNTTKFECYSGSNSVAPTNNTDQYGRYLIGGFTYHTNA